VLQGRIGLALHRLEDGEPPRQLGARRAAALCRAHASDLRGIAANGEGDFALERGRTLIHDGVGECVRELRGAVRGCVLDTHRHDVARPDDVCIQRGEQGVARAPETEQGAHGVCDKRPLDERRRARGRCSTAAGIVQHVDARERRVTRRRDEQLGSRAVLLRRRQRIAGGSCRTGRGQGDEGEPGQPGSRCERGHDSTVFALEARFPRSPGRPARKAACDAH
jgi:hypothetical protein